MRARQVFATLFGGGVGQAVPFVVAIVAINIVLYGRQLKSGMTPLLIGASTAAFIIIGMVTTAVVFLAPFWWLAKRRRLNFLSALLTGAVAGTILTIIAAVVRVLWWHGASHVMAMTGMGVDIEVLAMCGAIGAWAGWRLTEPKRVLPVGTAEMF